MNIESIKQSLLNLKNKESFFIDTGEESGYEIHKLNDYFIVFSIPQYGGYPILEKTWRYNYFNEMIDSLVDMVKTRT